MKSLIISIILAGLVGCASCPPQPKLKIQPPLLAEFTLAEIQNTPPSMLSKVGLYVAEVLGFVQKVKALPCVEGEGGGVK